MIKVIKDQETYESALTEISNLMDRDPQLGTSEADRLELLTLLVQDYEKKEVPARVPSSVEAIRFRMEQGNLSPRDLVPFIGSRSRVSEVLSGRRPLSLAMIRALHAGLGIPAKALLQEHDASELEETGIEWTRFPIREMVSRGWIKANLSEAKERAEDLLRTFFAPCGKPPEIAAMYKRTDRIRSARTMDKYALTAWTARIIILALNDPPPVQYKPNTVNLEFMREVVRLSWSDTGPVLAQEFLRKHGICLIIEPHLPRTHLDGAAIMVLAHIPIIGLSLRHDRIDNFWFCLMHELAHLSLHYGQGVAQFYDDLDVEHRHDPREHEADELAGEALIPESEWKKSPASALRSVEAAQELASRLRVHPAIVAGRIRHRSKSYQVLNQLIGHGQVRRLFKEVRWP
jgi:HTH-type transcriptional regulator / antitoxin HigA